MVRSSRASTKLVSVAVLGAMAACSRASQGPTPPRETSATASASGGASTPPFAAARAMGEARVVELTLAGERVAITMPPSWALLAAQSDAAAGLVAFAAAAGADGAPTPSLFLDGTPDVKVPASLGAAAAEALGRDDCTGTNAGACVELGRLALEGGGYVVSLVDPHRVSIEAWRASAHGRPVRCGADFPARPGTDARRDPKALSEQRALGEALCSSVHAAP